MLGLIVSGNEEEERADQEPSCIRKGFKETKVLTHFTNGSLLALA